MIGFTGYNAEYNTKYADGLFEHGVKIGFAKKLKELNWLKRLEKILKTF